MATSRDDVPFHGLRFEPFTVYGAEFVHASDQLEARYLARLAGWEILR